MAGVARIGRADGMIAERKRGRGCERGGTGGVRRTGPQRGGPVFECDRLTRGRRRVDGRGKGDVAPRQVREIGRASCREKSVDLGGRRIIKKKKKRSGGNAWR